MARLPSLADAPGTQREYETIYIVRPSCTNDDVADINGRVKGIIEDMGGKVLKVDNWGKRRLAYEVAKERKGIYLYWQYLGGAELVDEFERNMRMLDNVIRYMTVRLDEDVDPGARPTEIDDESYEKAANTAADEEDMYLQRGESSFDAGSDDDRDDYDYDKRSAAAESKDESSAAAESKDEGSAAAESKDESATESDSKSDSDASADEEN